MWICDPLNYSICRQTTLVISINTKNGQGGEQSRDCDVEVQKLLDEVQELTAHPKIMGKLFEMKYLLRARRDAGLDLQVVAAEDGQQLNAAEVYSTEEASAQALCSLSSGSSSPLLLV